MGGAAEGPLVAAADDVGVLCQAVAMVTAERVMARLAADGYGDVRVAHGYVIQGLMAGDTTSTQLAERLGVSVQAVSKSVTELERAGYVQRRRDARDGRARTIALTPRGEAMVRTSRLARAELAAEIVEVLGPDRAAALTAALRDVCERYGGLAALAGHRLRPLDAAL